MTRPQSTRATLLIQKPRKTAPAVRRAPQHREAIDLSGYPVAGPSVLRCRVCGGEAHTYSSIARFGASDYPAVVEAAKALPRRVTITPPKNKSGVTVVDFFPDVRRSGHSVSVCSACGDRRDCADSCWPRDAYYLTHVRGVRLWANNRVELIALREYIEKRANRGQGYHKLPKTIVRSGNRGIVLKAIDALLADK